MKRYSATATCCSEIKTKENNYERSKKYSGNGSLPSGDRSQVAITATAKSKLLPNNAIQTTLYVGADSTTGEIQAVEMVPQIPGQQSFDGDMQEEPKILRIVGGM